MSENVMEQPEDECFLQVNSGHPDNTNPVIDDIKVCGILTYGDGTPYQKCQFIQDCQDLKQALRFGVTDGAHSSNEIMIAESQSIQCEFFKLMVQWEREIIDAAKTCVVDTIQYLCEADVSNAIRLIYAHLKTCNAFSIIDSKIARETSFTINSEKYQKEQQENIVRILNVVKRRWLILVSLWGNDDKCAHFLSAAMTICSAGRETLEKTFANDEKMLLKIQELLEFERTSLKGNDKQFADKYFEEWLYARGIPIAGDNELENIIPQLKCALAEFSSSLTEEFIKIAIKGLRRLEDRTFWLHFSGHHIFDGVRCSTNKIPFFHHTLQAAGSLLSNIVVTIDCCFADAFVETYRFTVDAQAKNSGFTVISSCCSNEEAPIHSTFTKLVILALLSATRSRCASAPNLRTGESDAAASECQACTKFARKCQTTGTISIANIFSYIKGHLGNGMPIPTIRRHYSDEQLPVSRFINMKSSFTSSYN